MGGFAEMESRLTTVPADGRTGGLTKGNPPFLVPSARSNFMAVAFGDGTSN